MAIANRKGEIQLLDVNTLEQVGPDWKIYRDYSLDTVDFADTGDLMATASGESVQLWSPRTRQKIGDKILMGGSHGRATMSPDGKRLAIVNDSRATLWNLSSNDWKERACRIADRNMSRFEWESALGDLPYQCTCPMLRPHPDYPGFDCMSQSDRTP